MRQRETNFEILRIIAMMMIVMGHAVMHGLRCIGADTIPDMGFSTQEPADMVNFCGAQTLGYLCNVGVNLFILISGYFLVNAKPFTTTLRKGVTLWLQVLFYSLLIYGVAVGVGVETFSAGGLLSAMVPIYHNRYWFMTMYLALLLLSPFLSRLTQQLDKREYGCLLIVMLVLNFAQEGLGYGNIYSSGMSLLFFVFLFLIGGYIRRFDLLPSMQKYGLAAYVVVNVLLAASSIVLQVRSLGTPGHEFLYIKGLANNSFPLFTALALFLWVKQWKVNGAGLAKVVALITPYILGVYLLHDNGLLRMTLWKHIGGMVHEWWLLPYIVAISAGIFVVGILSDSVRARLFSLFKRSK